MLSYGDKAEQLLDDDHNRSPNMVNFWLTMLTKSLQDTIDDQQLLVSSRKMKQVVLKIEHTQKMNLEWCTSENPALVRVVNGKCPGSSC